MDHVRQKVTKSVQTPFPSKHVEVDFSVETTKAGRKQREAFERQEAGEVYLE